MMMGAFLRIIQKLAHSCRPVGKSKNSEGRAVIQGFFIKKFLFPSNPKMEQGEGGQLAPLSPPDNDGPEVQSQLSKGQNSVTPENQSSWLVDSCGFIRMIGDGRDAYGKNTETYVLKKSQKLIRFKELRNGSSTGLPAQLYSATFDLSVSFGS